MDTKPTPTLAKLHVSQEKLDYALAVYLYLEEKEGEDYQKEIKEVLESLCAKEWTKYPSKVRKIFTKEEVAELGIVPQELLKESRDNLVELQKEFDPDSLSVQDVENLKMTAQETEDTINDEDDLLSGETAPRLTPLGEGTYEEQAITDQQEDTNTAAQSEDLVPGLDEFASNYKQEVSKGLIDEDTSTGNEELDRKLQEDMDQKLINVLRIMRGMSADDLRRKLIPALEEGKKLEDLTLGDLEEILD